VAKYIGTYTLAVMFVILPLLSSSCGRDSEMDKKGKKGDRSAKYEVPDQIEIQQTSQPASPSKGTFKLIDSLPHSTDAFTQGLTYRDGKLIETTGLVGQSKINIIDAATGKVEKSVELPLGIFGEGNTLAGDTLYVISYKNQVMMKYHYPSLDKISTTSYYGEGWGLTYFNDELVMSNGTSTLFFRDPESFDLLKTQAITYASISKHYINELEATDDYIYANIWGDDEVMQIDARKGTVERIWDLSTLRYGQVDNNAAEVLNGVAFDSIRNLFYITGKNWDQIYLLKFE
jgi:glutaminyl-peptide cyclotransferase